jgi:ATP-dependent Clp protease ATP-binding subunit ClpA
MQTPLSVSAGGAVPLVDRALESTVLEQLIAAVRGGESRALVLHGEPGVGKTALLEFLVKRAADCRVISVSGCQSEMELAFAALQQCARHCWPCPSWPGVRLAGRGDGAGQR